MACLLLCFSGEPIPNDPKAFRQNEFQLSMMDTLTTNQPVCCVTYLLPFCCAYYTRYRLLDGDMSRYSCCQGYADCLCFRAGAYGEDRCPEICLCMESFLCLGPSISTSRIFLMDQYDLRSDPCDNQIVRLTNCLSCISTILDVLALFIEEIRHLAHIVDMAANCVFYSTVGCMSSQVNYEIDYRRATSRGHVKIVEADPLLDKEEYYSSAPQM